MVDIPSAELMLNYCICAISYLIHFGLNFFSQLFELFGEIVHFFFCLLVFCSGVATPTS